MAHLFDAEALSSLGHLCHAGAQQQGLCNARQAPVKHSQAGCRLRSGVTASTSRKQRLMRTPNPRAMAMMTAPLPAPLPALEPPALPASLQRMCVFCAASLPNLQCCTSSNSLCLSSCCHVRGEAWLLFVAFPKKLQAGDGGNACAECCL